MNSSITTFGRVHYILKRVLCKNKPKLLLLLKLSNVMANIVDPDHAMSCSVQFGSILFANVPFLQWLAQIGQYIPDPFVSPLLF